MNFALQSMASLAGVRQVAVADESGRLLACAGTAEAPTTAILVLAQATLSAASELGRRSGSGDCLEILQRHEGGFIYLHGLPLGRVLLVRFESDACLPMLRAACQRLAMPAEVQRSSSAALDLAAALHAEPAW